MTTPTQRIITATEASLDALDASLLDLQRAAAAKFGDVCAWCGGPCLCSTYSDWDADLALALSEAACPDCTPPDDAARCACCWDILTPDDATYCAACALDGAHLIDTPPPPPDDALPAIARLWGRLERGEIDGDRYLALLREGGWA